MGGSRGSFPSSQLPLLALPILRVGCTHPQIGHVDRRVGKKQVWDCRNCSILPYFSTASASLSCWGDTSVWASSCARWRSVRAGPHVHQHLLLPRPSPATPAGTEAQVLRGNPEPQYL